MEQKSSGISLGVASLIIIGVLFIVVAAGTYIGNKFFWLPTDSRSFVEKRNDLIENAYKANPKSKNNSLAYAIALYERGRRTESEKLFKDLLTKFPNDNAVLFNYAKLKVDSGDKKTAAEYFKKLLQKTPYFVPANVQYGIILRDENKFDEALKRFDNALKFEPGAADILLERAKVYIAMKEVDKAKEDLNKALSLVPNYKEAESLLEKLN